MEKIELGELQTLIDQIIGKIGTRSFLRFLQDFDKKFDFRSDAMLNIIENIITQYFEITADQLYKGVDIREANARRAMMHLLKEKTGFDDKQIKAILNISRQTYSNYIIHLNELYANKAVNPDLAKALIKINEIFKIKQNGRYQSNTTEQTQE